MRVDPNICGVPLRFNRPQLVATIDRDVRFLDYVYNILLAGLSAYIFMRLKQVTRARYRGMIGLVWVGATLPVMGGGLLLKPPNGWQGPRRAGCQWLTAVPLHFRVQDVYTSMIQVGGLLFGVVCAQYSLIKSTQPNPASALSQSPQVCVCVCVLRRGKFRLGVRTQISRDA